MIVTVANLKGGVGKTTSSVFLAHALGSATGERCVVIDADPQGSAAQWAKVAAGTGRPLAVPVLAQPTARLTRMVHGAPNLVIDTPPAHSETLEAAMAVADVVVVPTSASAMDLAAIRTTVAAARRARRPAAVLLTRTRRVRSVGAAEHELRAEGIRVLETHVPLREAVALAFGQPVQDLHGYDLVAAEVLGCLPVRPFAVETVLRRTGTESYRPRPVPATGFDDDELIQRLRRSTARLTAPR